MLFGHLCTALVTTFGSGVTTFGSGVTCTVFVFRLCVLDFSSVSGHVYRSVFYFRVRTRHVLVALCHSTSPCFVRGWRKTLRSRGKEKLKREDEEHAKGIEPRRGRDAQR